MTPEEIAGWVARVPEAQRQELRQALVDGWRIETNWLKIRARYVDLDLANAVPRVILYLDLGVLIGKLLQYQRLADEAGLEFVEEE